LVILEFILELEPGFSKGRQPMTRKERAVMNGSSDDAIMFNHFVSFCSICFPNQLHAEQTQQEKKQTLTFLVGCRYLSVSKLLHPNHGILLHVVAVLIVVTCIE
jgi:hypothetical protein